MATDLEALVAPAIMAVLFIVLITTVLRGQNPVRQARRRRREEQAARESARRQEQRSP
jgi:hypothetical protein